MTQDQIRAILADMRDRINAAMSGPFVVAHEYRLPESYPKAGEIYAAGYKMPDGSILKWRQGLYSNDPKDRETEFCMNGGILP